MRFHAINLGCKVNRVEIDEVSAILLSARWECVAIEEADLIVINTCTVTGEADRKTRKMVHRALQANDYAHVLVTGCAAAISPDVYAKQSSRMEVVPKRMLVSRVRELAAAQFGDVSCLAVSGPRDGRYLPNTIWSSDIPLRIGEGFNTRVSLKIQDGCARACTYCIVHVARGVPWSKPFAQVKSEIERYCAAGVKEIVLTGINLGSYDHDGCRLTDLLEEVLSVTDSNLRFRLSSIEPMDVDERLIELIAQADGRVCRHLHLPVQSGSTKVLREMDRPYTAEDYLRLVRHIRERIPAMALSTDIIAGFPGETEDDFDQSIDLCKMAGFVKMHVFPYSRREGTPAAQRADQVPPDVKARRATQLRDLSLVLRAEDMARRSGTIERALVEAAGSAMTESYYEVQADPQAPANSYVLYRFP